MPDASQLYATWAGWTIEQRRSFIRENELAIKWVEIPVDFDTFVESPKYLSFGKLSPIQKDFILSLSEIFDLEAAQNDPEQVCFAQRQYVESVAVWGKGCIAGDTILQDAVTGETKAVAEWVQQPLSIISLNVGDNLEEWEIVRSRATQVFRRGFGRLLRVTTCVGFSIDVFVAHKFLTKGRGVRWETVANLRKGDWIATDQAWVKRFLPGYESNVYWDRIASIEEIGEGDYYDLTVPGPETYIAHGFWNHNSGKDTCVRIAFSRVLYLLGCLFDPHTVFGMPSFDSIDILNIALNASQADQVFFDPWKRMIRDSPWFMDKLQVVIRNRSISCPPIVGYRKGIGDMYAINAWSGHGERESMEGRNLLLAVLDEVDAFVLVKETRSNTTAKSVDLIYDMATSSVQSRFPGIGKVALISWPRMYNGFIMQRLRAGEQDEAVFASGPYATWEVNPRVTESDFDTEFRRNPERARAKYMARPGRVLEGYFSNTPAVLQTFHAEMTHDFDIIRSTEDPGVEPPVNWDRMQVTKVAPPDASALYCWHVDLALRNDRAAVAMAHHSGWIYDMDNEPVPVITLDLAFWWEAREGSEINFAEIRKFILAFARSGYRIGTVTLDGFQSRDFMQIMSGYTQAGRKVRYRRNGKPIGVPIEAKHLSCDANTVVYDTLKEMIYEPGRLEAFYCQLIVEELLALILVAGGRKVDHPTSGSKDISDAVAGAVHNAGKYLNERLTVPYRGSEVGLAVVGAKRTGEWGIEEDSPTIYSERDRPRAFG